MQTASDFEREAMRWYWLEQLQAHQGNVTKTAKAAGVNRTLLYKRLTRLGLSRAKERRRATRMSPEFRRFLGMRTEHAAHA